MAYILAFPVLLAGLLLQSVVISRLQFISGSADIVLIILVAWSLQRKVTSAWFWAIVAGLAVSFVSATPIPAIFLGYLLSVGIARVLQGRVWQIPILAMLMTVTIGTLILHLLYSIGLFVNGIQVQIEEAFSLVTLPTVLLNLLFSIPVYALVADLARRVYPEEVEA